MYYVMSDIHGSYGKMEKALKQWNQNNEHLVVIGDLIDRGPDSLKVVRKLMQLRKDNPDNVTVLKGNHEDMLLSWITETPQEHLGYYYNEGHNETFKSFMGHKRYKKSSRRQRPLDLLYNNKEELRFMKSLPLYMEEDKVIFVHAGINLEIDDWRRDEEFMLWARNEFIYSLKSPEKRVFFGHTPTSFIHNDVTNSNIWVSPDGMKVGIDGAASMGGQLNVLRVSVDGDVAETLAF